MQFRFRHVQPLPRIRWIPFASICLVGALVVLSSVDSRAIEVSPTAAQIDRAVKQGLETARTRVPPNRLYAWFGSDHALRPKGFLMTKMNALTVMASHFGLRGDKPSEPEIRRILAEETMRVNVTIFGDTPTFADNSYMVLKQGEKLVKPLTVRFDGVAHRTERWPDAPRYRARVIGAFRYDAFDPDVHTTILVFPSEGGEVSFDLDFSRVP